MMIPDSLGSEALFLPSGNAASLLQVRCDQEGEARNAIFGAPAPQRAWVCPLYTPELEGSREDKHLSNATYRPGSEGQYPVVNPSEGSQLDPVH